MADVVSELAVKLIEQHADEFVVRLDVPVGPSDPQTLVAMRGAQNQGHCAVQAALALAENQPTFPEANLQVRVWRFVGGTRQLVFDRSTQAGSFSAVMTEFARQDELAALPPLSPEATAKRKAFGGPFDTDHALIVATARAATTE
ncbi:hypothetical protein WDY80_24275 (plasmid) [Gordonia hongkongensis]|uniref:hypothetical protein n=1 Tax=Gordonia hongkongensis TaxID=1701090 RepID=UPI0030D24CF9